MTIEIPVWPYVYGSPACFGDIRSVPEDFVVYENLAFEPSGTGEHVFLQIQKKGENTELVTRQLARFANVRQRDIGYAGLKDRHAISTQWFSVWLPGQSDPDWDGFQTETIKILQVLRHARKLKRGALSGNRFEITVRNWQGDTSKALGQLALIKEYGIANYYGEQRFGHQGQNVNKAVAMFKGMKVNREQRSLYLSAARSFMFNQILAARVAVGNWDKALAGDIFMFDQSHSYFKSLLPDEEIVQRLHDKAIHPTGVLWGRGGVDISGDALAIEQAVIGANDELAQGLVTSGVDKSRRTLRVKVEDLEWQDKQSSLQLSFTLPVGSFATALLREIIGD